MRTPVSLEFFQVYLFHPIYAFSRLVYLNDHSYIFSIFCNTLLRNRISFKIPCCFCIPASSESPISKEVPALKKRDLISISQGFTKKNVVIRNKKFAPFGRYPEEF